MTETTGDDALQENPGYGTREYFDQLQAEHDGQEKAFNDAGWHSLDVQHPFYLDAPGVPEGSVRTVADTRTKSPGRGPDWFWIDADVQPRQGMAHSRSVYKVEEGQWVWQLEQDAR